MKKHNLWTMRKTLDRADIERDALEWTCVWLEFQVSARSIHHHTLKKDRERKKSTASIFSHVPTFERWAHPPLGPGSDVLQEQGATETNGTEISDGETFVRVGRPVIMFPSVSTHIHNERFWSFRSDSSSNSLHNIVCRYSTQVVPSVAFGY